MSGAAAPASGKVHATRELTDVLAQVRDELRATRAAIEEGCVPGGGVALVRAAEAIDGQGEITVATRTAEGGRFIEIEFTDTGCGISPENLDKIFDPFFSTKFTGRGLGLAAVLGIVRGHKGGLKVYSEPGKGTTFLIRIPVTRAARSGSASRRNWTR